MYGIPYMENKNKLYKIKNPEAGFLKSALDLQARLQRGKFIKLVFLFTLSLLLMVYSMIVYTGTSFSLISLSISVCGVIGVGYFLFQKNKYRFLSQKNLITFGEKKGYWPEEIKISKSSFLIKIKTKNHDSFYEFPFDKIWKCFSHKNGLILSDELHNIMLLPKESFLDHEYKEILDQNDFCFENI